MSDARQDREQAPEPGARSPKPAGGRIAPAPFDTIAVVGLGLIGGSIALAARKAWPSVRVIGVDTDEVARQAAALLAADVVSSDLAAVSGAGLVILAAPVQRNIGLLPELSRSVRRSAVVTDVGSTKRAIVEASRRFRGELTFVGGHPVAGAATSGIEFAKADLFARRRWLFTPETDTPREAVEWLWAFVKAIGAEPHSMDASEHDHLMAFVSHLPQLTALALMQVVGDEVDAQGLQFAGPGLVDTTRLAESPIGTWGDICLTNVDFIRAALDQLVDALDYVGTHLSDREGLKEIFGAARGWRDLIRPPTASRIPSVEPLEVLHQSRGPRP